MQNIDLELTFNAKLDKVYHAFVSPELLQKWFCPLGMVVQQAMSNSKIDGQFRLILSDPMGNQHVLVGRYKEMKRNELLSFSWQWLDEEHSTNVVLHFKEIDEGTTQLTLHHGEFHDAEDFNLHCQAWVSCLEQLSIVLSTM